MADSQKKQGGTRCKSTVVWAVVLAVCLIGAGAGAFYIVTSFDGIADVQNSDQITPKTPAEDPDLQVNPIDFPALQKENADVCGWVYVPGTEVNYAVVQHSEDDAYYLTHDEKGKTRKMGSVFIERINERDFSDPVTIMYGHNWVQDKMFSTLHRFEDAAFFDKNDSIYVYAPGHIYTYRIISAFTTDDTHLMYKYGGFSEEKQLKHFERDLLDPHSISQHVRDTKLGAQDRFVVLSTCNTGALAQYGRYLVCGVMVDDQQTR